MDLNSILGILLAIGMILLGQALEGGHAGSLVQPTAALIVFGGTIGSVMVAYPMSEFIHGVKLAKLAFTNPKHDLPGVARQLVELATLARKEGVLALEAHLGDVQDPFMRKALGYIVDGVDAEVTRDSLDTAIDAEFHEVSAASKVWETAGGLAPTIGILGAVLGLIHVMENLSDPSKLGGGIAVAFVATVYAVGAANILFLPMAAKIKRRLTLAKERKVLIMEGILAIQAGLNPRVLEEKLRAYTGEEAPSADAQKKAA
ncbi:MAG: flagellar motor protein [Anaeromyxobacteraceae bacterium]